MQRTLGVAANVVVDAGPIVAWLNAGDAYHDWAKEQFASLRPPLLTCEPVLAEAGFLMRRGGGNEEAVLVLLEKRVLTAVFRLDEHAAEIRTLIRRYRSVPMTLADACLVRMSAASHDMAVMTLDADFRIYRRNGRQIIPLVAPEGI